MNRNTLLARRRFSTLSLAVMCAGLVSNAPVKAQDAPAKTETSEQTAKLAEMPTLSQPTVRKNLFAFEALADKSRKLRLASLAALAPEDKKEEPTGPKPGEVTITGLLDWYYGVNTKAPGHTPYVTPSGDTINIDNLGRAFDIKDRQPGFSLGELNITRAPGKGLNLGLTATLTIGDTGRLVHATEPGGTANYAALQQLYVTGSPKILGHDLTVDAGVFATPFGYEVIESSNNDNYSRSFNFALGVPLYHAGVRATTTLNPKWSLQAGLVNGWNNIADDNNAKSIYAQLTYKAGTKFTNILGWMGGAEGTGAFGAGVPTAGAGGVTMNLFDWQAILTPTDKLKIVGWFTYGSAAGSIQAAGKVSGNWIGMTGIARYQVTPKFAWAARIEQFEDMPGTGGFAPRLGLGYSNLKSYTFTLEYTVKTLVSRLEWRHDTANQSLFGSAAGAVADQDTIMFGQVFKF
ncbi:hypothetical protein LBMAG21_03090 [Armatimonadota bacterium]|nr:hypothetical protein LBMAG21_03090 [Armatimonadota bacterium]